jgi:hypothetical protein
MNGIVGRGGLLHLVKKAWKDAKYGFVPANSLADGAYPHTIMKLLGQLSFQVFSFIGTQVTLYLNVGLVNKGFVGGIVFHHYRKTASANGEQEKQKRD